MANSGNADDKLARTMRIDIAPETLDAPSGTPSKGRGTRIITKRSRRAETPRQRQAAAPDKKSSKPATVGSDFQELLQSVYDAAIITDMSGKIIDANSRAATFFRYDREELAEMSVLDVISGSDANLIETICQNLVARFVLIEACYCTRKDGTFFPAEIAVNQLKLSAQDHLCFFIRDITIRRQAEEQLRIEHNAIQNSRSGIAMAELDGSIFYVNPSVCRLWGYESAEDLTGKDIRDLWTEGSVGDTFVQDITTGDQTWMHEITARKEDGTEFDVQVSAAANQNADGELAGMVFSIVDISDRKRAEEAERDAERNRVMLESLGAACHHLGQPATVLLANLGIMKHKTADGESSVGDLINSCMEAAESLSDTLHKLNGMNEYRTTPYLEDSETSSETRILDI